jgi:hypothetical protein
MNMASEDTEANVDSVASQVDGLPRRDPPELGTIKSIFEEYTA